MLAGTVLLWVGVPLGAVYAGSLVEGETGSTGAAIVVMFALAAAAIAALVRVLMRLSARRVEQLAARGDPYGSVALEAFMAVGAGLAVVGFATWWLFLA